MIKIQDNRLIDRQLTLAHTLLMSAHRGAENKAETEVICWSIDCYALHGMGLRRLGGRREE